MPLPQGRSNQIAGILEQKDFDILLNLEMRTQAVVSEISERTGVSVEELRAFAPEVLGDMSDTGGRQECSESGSLPFGFCRNGNYIEPSAP